MLVVVVENTSAPTSRVVVCAAAIAIAGQRREPAVDEVVFNLAPAYLKLSLALRQQSFLRQLRQDGSLTWSLSFALDCSKAPRFLKLGTVLRVDRRA